MQYVMILPLQFYRLNEHEIACESAFAGHLRDLVARIEQWDSSLLIISPTMSLDDYTKAKSSLSVINSNVDKIFHCGTHASNLSKPKYFLKFFTSILPKFIKHIKKASIIHAGPSNDIFRPYEFIGILLALLFGKKTIFVTDIDHRKSADMDFQVGTISKRQYYTQKYLYLKWWSMQLWVACKFCSLCLLKGKEMVEDFGKGRSSVINFLDTAHSEENILSEEKISTKLTYLEEKNNQINLVYFGRLVEYKGIQDMIDITSIIHDLIKNSDKFQSVKLEIIGAGPQLEMLKNHSLKNNVNDLISFSKPVKYGSELFDKLCNFDFLLATPWHQDTPRSAFDAMCAGLTIAAYDTYYYRDLAETAKCVITSKWTDKHALAKKIIECKSDTKLMKEMSQNALTFAKNNTQDIWLDKRLNYTKQFCI